MCKACEVRGTAAARSRNRARTLVVLERKLVDVAARVADPGDDHGNDEDRAGDDEEDVDGHACLLYTSDAADE